MQLIGWLSQFKKARVVRLVSSGRIKTGYMHPFIPVVERAKESSRHEDGKNSHVWQEVPVQIVE